MGEQRALACCMCAAPPHSQGAADAHRASHRAGADFADEYLKSALFQHNEELVARLSEPKAGAQALAFTRGYAHGWKTQFKELLQ